MLPLSLLPLLLAIFVISIRADDSFTSLRDGIVRNTTATPTSTSASFTTSNSQSTLTTSATSTTLPSTSASATSTSLATSNAFQWDGSEIAATVILLSFIIFGVAFITVWQARRMLAKRRDNASLGAYAKHERHSAVDTDFVDADAVMVMNQPPQHSSNNPASNSTNMMGDLERASPGIPAALFRSYTPALQGPSILVPPANSGPHSGSPSPYSEAVLRPSSQNTLRRSFSFEGIRQSTDPGHLVRRVDQGSVTWESLGTNRLSSFPRYA